MLASRVAGSIGVASNGQVSIWIRDRVTTMRFALASMSLGFLPMCEPSGVADNQRNQTNLKMVRKGGFEPLRYCYRQPLKLVRLPVPPLPQGLSEKPVIWNYEFGIWNS